MKRIVAAAFCLVPVLVLAGCEKRNNAPEKTELLPETAESFLKSETAESLLKNKNFDFSYTSQIVYVNWAEFSDVIRNGTLNSDKMMESSVQHLPIWKIDTSEELNIFKQNYKEIFQFDSSYNESQSFYAAVASCDETYFENNSLIISWISANSGSYRFAVEDVYCDGQSFCMWVRQINNPESVTDDMAGWFAIVGVRKADIENCSSFDSQLK